MMPVHDFSLNSGERQVGTTYQSIRADHRYRYEWADACIPRTGFGVDIFCGNGYGTWLLSEARWVLGIDGSAEAIRLADQYFRRPSGMFSVGVYPFTLPVSGLDFVVSLESIEHVEDGSGFFRSLADSLKPGGVLVFSTPCEDQLPLAGTGNHFHHRHYTLTQTLELASSHDLILVEWAGQDVYMLDDQGRQCQLLPEARMRLKVGEPGQFLVVVCQKLPC
jgi:SAM-dependent methyltransferase